MNRSDWSRPGAKRNEPDLPGPPLPGVLQTTLFWSAPTRFLQECEQRYGDLFFCRFFSQSVGTVFVSAPDDIRTIFTGSPSVMEAGAGNVVLRPIVGKYSLLLLDGEEHVRMRRLLMPPLHGDRMPVYAQVIREQTDEMLDRWAPGALLPLRPALQELTLQVILRAVFGLSEGREQTRLATLLRRYSDESGSALLFFPQFQRDLGPLSPWGRFLSLRRQTTQALMDVIESRRRTAGLLDRNYDILSLLLSARDEDNQALSDRELRDELITMLIAGHETTATALEWTIYLVLRHPRVHVRMMEELKTVFGHAGGPGPLDVERLSRLEYTEAVIREALRLRPILPNVARKLRSPIRLRNHEIQAGTFVAPCIYLTHLRPDLYPDPHAFLPERFVGHKPDPYGWLPFGGGARRCIGMAFALLEMKVVLATLFQRAELSLPDLSDMPIVRRSITLAPRGVRLRKGHNWTT